MTPSELDDPILERVRAARPAPPAGADHVPARAHEQLSEILSSPRVPGRRGTVLRGRMAGALIPSLAVGVAVAVAAVAILVLSPRRPHALTAPAATRPSLHLTAQQYAVALGADSMTAQATGSSRADLLFGAEQSLRSRCMRQRGFTYVMEPTAAPLSLPSNTGQPTTFYPQPTPAPYAQQALLGQRARMGFGLYPEAMRGRGLMDPEEKYLKSLAPATRTRWLKAWGGRSGCYQTARAQLYGSRRAADMHQLLPSQIYNYLTSTVYTRAGALSSANHRTANVAAAWSRCVRAQTGQTFTDEDGIITWLLNGATPSGQRTQAFRSREIRYARVSTTCAYRVGQPQAFFDAFRTAADHLPASLAGQLRFLLAHDAGWVRRARAIVGS